MLQTILSRRPAILTEASALWQLAWPVVIGQLATVGMSVADVAMTGHLGADDLAAVSLGASIWTIVVVTIMGIMMAINAVVAHEVGAGTRDRIPHAVRQSLWKALGVGVVATILTNWSTIVFDHLGLDALVHAKASLFVHVISIGLLPFAAYRVLYGYSASLNQTKPVMVIALFGLAFNVFVNWLLVYGHWGFPQLGAVGCAWATGLGLWLMLGAMIWWIKRASVYQDTTPFSGWEGPQWQAIYRMLKMGLPIGVTYFAEVSAFSVVGLLVARFGAVTISAHQIALNFSSLVFMVPLSLGIALLTRVGQAAGEGDAERARFVSWVGVGVSLAFAVLSASFIALFRYQIAAAYTSDAAVQELTVHLLWFAALFQLSDATQVAASCAIRGYKVTRPPMVIHLTAFWGFSIPLGCVLGLAPAWLPWGPAEPMAATGFWIGLVLGLSVAAVGLVWYLHRLSTSRVRQQRARLTPA
ncbi:MATE family efflux transporter [Actimicrobium antarcticum]|uniref:Multidrug-efflux transporter n=1 Tax=Actimicrobium antarcticum TaxID=1051899 RepID=A0ABP7SWC6_9BURK